MTSQKLKLSALGIAVTLASTSMFAQAPQTGPVFPWAGQDAATAAPTTVTPPRVVFNPRELSGVWLRQGQQALSDGPPPKMTAAGEAAFRKSIVSVPNEIQRDNIPPIKGNDPIMRCDPWGFPRVLWDFAAPMEFVHAPNRILQFFEWTHVWRDIWMDGRPLPKDPDPRWMGYSVGRWDGDTHVLIVETVGFDEKTWLDELGHRHSGKGKFIERYTRLDAATMSYDATLIDPDYYTEPWVGTRRIFRLLPMAGWPQAELREEFCAPSVEIDFNETIRDPAGGKTTP
jgi:hypothetical protein